MMTTAEEPEARALPAPAHPLHQLTTYELRDYRAELEHAIEGVSPDAPAAADLRRLLSELLDEESSRVRYRQQVTTGGASAV